MTDARRSGRLLVAAGAVWVALAATGATVGPTAAPRPTPRPRWSPVVHATRVVDVSATRGDGTAVVATNGRLALLHPGGALTRFARGPGGYTATPGGEPYLTLSPAVTETDGRCAFHRGDTYILDGGRSPGVVVVDTTGAARRFVDLPPDSFPNGIAFDDVGAFGHRLLVTARAANHTQLLAISCAGTVEALTATAPQVEGGEVVAPATFGAYAGDLVAPDELSGRILAFDPHGHVRIIAASGVPHGGDVGVESAGFAPADLGSEVAYLADLHAPGNPHPGSDHVLGLSGAALAAAGVHAGDLLVATEGGARTVAVRCDTTCKVHHVADGPTPTHGEGHLVFEPRPH